MDYFPESYHLRVMGKRIRDTLNRHSCREKNKKKSRKKKKSEKISRRRKKKEKKGVVPGCSYYLK